MTCLRPIFTLLATTLFACNHASKSEAPLVSSAPSSATAPTHPLELTYLGVAGWELDDGPHALLVDPYFSRHDARNSTNLLVPDDAAISHHAPKSADLILVTHSHYDHALDVATVAKRTHAAVAGTESTLNLARAEGVPENDLLLASPHAAIDRGPFDVRVFRSLHSLTGQAYAEIPRDVKLPLGPAGYGEGGTLQYLVSAEGHSIFFVGSANFIETEIQNLGPQGTPPSGHPNVAIVATGLREKIPDYACRLMRALGNPPLVITNHFDEFWKPVEEDVSPSAETRADLASFEKEVHACSPTTRVVVPQHFQRFDL